MNAKLKQFALIACAMVVAWLPSGCAYYSVKAIEVSTEGGALRGGRCEAQLQ